MRTRLLHVATVALATAVALLAGPAGAADPVELPATIVISTAGGPQTVSVEADYIPGVVRSESGWVPGTWYGVSDAQLQPALEAQAVAARTYLLRYLNQHGHAATVPVGPSFQAYNPAFDAADLAAASATAGQVMTYQGHVINANYDSGAWPIDAQGWPFGPAYYGYPYATWDALRDAWLADPGGMLTELNTQYDDTWSWTWLFVTINEGKTGDAVTPTIQADTTKVYNRGALGQYRALWLAAHGHDHVEILRYFYGADVVIEGAGAAPPPIAPPAGDPDLAVDIAFTDIDLADATCIAEAGYGTIIINTYFGPTISQLQVAEAAGLVVHAYVPLYWNESAAGSLGSQVATALGSIAASGVDVDILWLDAEVPTTGYSQAQIVDKIGDAVAACGATPCGIYTRRTWWDPATGQSSAFSDLPLWYALYDGDPEFVDWDSPTAPHHGPFGGWSAPAWKQYAGTTPQGYMPPGFTSLCGVTVDYNATYQGGGGGPDPVPASPPNISGALVPDGGAQVAPPSVTLSWSAAGADDHEVQVEYGDGDGVWSYYWAAQTGSGATDHTLWPEYDEAYYRWRVRAHNPYGWGPWSAHATFYFGTAPLPDAPVILTPDDGGTLAGSPVSVAWIPVAGATSYEVRVTTAAGDLAHQSWPQASPVSVALDASGDHAFAVRALGADGWGPFATVTALFVGDGFPDENVPPAPTGLWPSGGTVIAGGSVTLSCNPASGGLEYELEIDAWSGGAWTDYTTYSTPGPEKTFWPQLPDTHYRWRARARGEAGWGPWSSFVLFGFGDVEATGGDDDPGDPPGPAGEGPVGLTPSGGEGAPGPSVTLSCDDVGGATQYEFEVRWWDGGAWAHYYTYTASTSVTTFWPAIPDVSYRWKVRAMVTGAWSPWSAWAEFAFGQPAPDDPPDDDPADPDLPPAPGGLSPSGGAVGGDSVTLSCDPVPGATGYAFEIEVWEGGAWSTYYTWETPGPSQTFWPTVADTTYRWRVRAESDAGWGPWSVWVAFDYGDDTGGDDTGGDDTGGGGDTPDAPSGLESSGGAEAATSVTLSCDPVPGATGYAFEIEVWDGAWSTYYTYETTTPSQTFWPAVEDTTYRWRVRAEDAAGWGAWSAWEAFDYPSGSGGGDDTGDDDPGAPGAPTGLSPSGGETVSGPSVTLSCSGVAGATGYEVAIEWDSGGWTPYYTYAPAACAQTFWPAVASADFRWRARAESAAGWGPWSGWAEFTYED